jgi:GNAT superfamily N-acetyltransferase
MTESFPVCGRRDRPEHWMNQTPRRSRGGKTAGPACRRCGRRLGGGVAAAVRPRADPAVVEAWVRGWTLCRQTAPPEAVAGGGWRVEVGWPDQQARYVFPEPDAELERLGHAIEDAWVYLKACAPVDEVAPLLPPRWRLEARGAMMLKPALMAAPVSPPQGYKIGLETYGPVTVAQVTAPDGDFAAWGRVARSGDFAVFDRVATAETHRRRGLGRSVMATLERIGEEAGATGGLLVATPMGLMLYEPLGWRLHAHYASAVIPGPA